MKNRRRRFTLIEMLVVVTIIVILVAILLPALSQARAQVYKAKCMGQLDQFGLALNMYRQEHDEGMALWLSRLYPEYIREKRLYVCPQDASSGHDGGRTGGVGDTTVEPIDPLKCVDEYPDTDDTESNTYTKAPGCDRNTEITHCSYMYEFSGAVLEQSVGGSTRDWGPCTDAPKTWNAVKEDQLRFGLGRNSNSFCEPGELWQPALFPTARCFFHWSVSWGKDELVLNTAYEGRVFESRIRWEDGTY